MSHPVPYGVPAGVVGDDEQRLPVPLRARVITSTWVPLGVTIALPLVGERTVEGVWLPGACAMVYE